MGTKAVLWALAHEELKPFAHNVLWCMAETVDDESEPWAFNGRLNDLAAKCALSRRDLSEAFAELQAHGLIRGGRPGSREWTLCPDRDDQEKAAA